MSTTTTLLATKIEASQSQKEVTSNAAFDIFDKAIAGSLSKAVTAADVTLSDDEARNAILNISGTLTGNRALIVPARTKIYAVYNGTAGAFTLTVKTSGGTGIAVTQGSRVILYCDGTNVVALSVSNAAVTLIVAASDETTALTTGTAKFTFRMPFAMTLTAIRGSLVTAQATGSIFTVDVNETGGSILSTKLTIDNTEKTSTTAATPAVLSDTALADDAEITIDIDQIGDGTAKGLKVALIGVRS